MLRAAGAPERFLGRGFSRFVPAAVSRGPRRGAPGSKRPLRESAALHPRDLATFLARVGDTSVGDFAPRAFETDFGKLVAKAKRAGAGRAVLTALLAGAVPFGGARGGDLFLYCLGDATSAARGIVATLDPETPAAPRIVCRGASTFALVCALGSAGKGKDSAAASAAAEALARIPRPSTAEQEEVRAAFDRARLLAEALLGTDAALRALAKKLALRPLEVPPPPRPTSKRDRATSLALAPLVETFLLASEDEARAALEPHRGSADRVVASAAIVLLGALDLPRTALARDLVRRRELAMRAVKTTSRRPASVDLGRRIVAHFDASRPPSGDPLAMTEQREEALLALAELGDASVLPSLVARAVTGDVAAVHMLGALGERSVVPHLVGLLRRESAQNRALETAVVRALVTLDAKSETPTLRQLLADNPMTGWREGLERGQLVRELVLALGELRDTAAGGVLVSILEARSQEYRAVLPWAAWALGRIGHVPAFATLERLLVSPKEPPSCETVWALGAIAAQDDTLADRATAILEDLRSLEPGAEIVRLVALAKLDRPARSVELRRALEKALWEPAFRQEETSRRRVWALRSLEELSSLGLSQSGAFFLGHEGVRYFVTRDDHRVRRAAEDAFTKAGAKLPKTRRIYAVILDDLERRHGLEGLHEAVRDPLAVFRHNAASRLAERGSPSSVRPLAEATARLFAEPPTSTYEYDDAPMFLVAFVRALAKLNRNPGNDVLIEGLRGGNHQVRAVVAENAPDDPRFVPELMAMLGDPRSFLRSRAERSLAALGVGRPRAGDGPLSPTSHERRVRVEGAPLGALGAEPHEV